MVNALGFAKQLQRIPQRRCNGLPVIVGVTTANYAVVPRNGLPSACAQGFALVPDGTVKQVQNPKQLP